MGALSRLSFFFLFLEARVMSMISGLEPFAAGAGHAFSHIYQAISHIFLLFLFLFFFFFIYTYILGGLELLFVA